MFKPSYFQARARRDSFEYKLQLDMIISRLKPKALTWIPWEPEVKLPKIGIVLIWVIFLALDFQCTLSLVICHVIVGVFR
jgi:hypothetical protein